MAADSSSYGDGPFSAADDDAQSEAPAQDPWEQPLYMIPRRGRPSNWAKKFHVQQARVAALQSEGNEQEQTKPQPDKSPSPQKPKRKRAAKPQARKSAGGAIPAEPANPSPRKPTPEVQVTPSPRNSPAPTQEQPAEHNEPSPPPVLSDEESLFGGDARSLFGGGDGPKKSPSPLPEADSLFVGDDNETNEPQPARQSERLGSADSATRASQVPDLPRPAASSPGPDHAKLEAELATMTHEVRRWEAVTQQVANETREMSKLVADLAASSFASQPKPSAVVADMLPPADQARFRDQLLRATQLSLKADLVRTLERRDSRSRELQAWCVVVLAVAGVLAAFLLSPFAAWVVGGLEWVVDRAGVALKMVEVV